MRYGIFGGSFDPPHEGHLHVAHSARHALSLDSVLWIPAPDPPHKARPGTPYIHRLAMTRLAVAGHAGHEVSDIESRLPSPSYSIHTVEALKAERGAGHDWHLLVGADNWAIFPTWHRHAELMREVTVAVYPRGGITLGDLPEGVVRLDFPEVDAESRSIRQDLARSGESAASRLLPGLREYCREHGLYGLKRDGGAGIPMRDLEQA